VQKALDYTVAPTLPQKYTTNVPTYSINATGVSSVRKPEAPSGTDGMYDVSFALVAMYNNGSNQMTLRQPVFAVLLIISVCRCVPAAAQTTESASGVAIIDINDPRPLLAALEILEKRHGLAISYEDPVYSASSDISDTAINPTSGKIFRIHIPRGGAFHFQYPVENGKPQEDTQTLLRRMLFEYANVGNPTFDLQEHVFERGTRWHFPENLRLSEWHVVPVKVRNKNGQFVSQPPLLDNIVSVVQQRGTYARPLGDICQQLTVLSGREIIIGNVPLNYLANAQYQTDFGVTNGQAREALADLLGPSMVWGLLYEPEDDRYVLNIHIANLPPRSAAVAAPPPTHMSDPAHPMSREEAYAHMSVAAARHYTLPKEQVSQIQSALAHEGFYHGEPTGVWDNDTVEAMRNFQFANNLLPSGRWDGPTIRKLGIAITPSPAGRTPQE
jgi:hypothetical protein